MKHLGERCIATWKLILFYDWDVMTFWTLQVINGVSLGMMLFLLAAGLSLIFGLMNILNLAHGSLFMVAAYIGMSIGLYTGNFFLAVVGGSIGVGILGILIYSTLLRHYLNNPLAQVLLTLGILCILADLVSWVWGKRPLSVNKPTSFTGPIDIGEISFAAYQLLIIVVGVIVGVFLWWFQERTEFGAIVRAAVDDKDMAESIGINIPLVMGLVFGLGALLAGIAGVIGGAFMGMYPGVDLEILLLTVPVIIIGGLGSLKGAIVGALIVGLIDCFGKSLFPEFSIFLLFALVTIVLAFRPRGLFGRK